MRHMTYINKRPKRDEACVRRRVAACGWDARGRDARDPGSPSTHISALSAAKAAAFLHAGSIAAAFLHAGSVAAALLRAARALSVQKRHANERDV